MACEIGSTRIPFDESVLDEEMLSTAHRDVARRILRLVKMCTPETITLTVALDWNEAHVISASSTRERSCPFSIYLYHELSSEGGPMVGIRAGEGVAFKISDDLYPPTNRDAAHIVENAVQAILQGRISETIYYAGSKAYRWEFELTTDDGPLGFGRAILMDALLGVFKAKKKKTISYRPYDLRDDRVRG